MNRESDLQIMVKDLKDKGFIVSELYLIPIINRIIKE